MKQESSGSTLAGSSSFNPLTSSLKPFAATRTPEKNSNTDQAEKPSELKPKYQRRNTRFLNRWTSSIYEKDMSPSPEIVKMIEKESTHC